MCFTQAYSLDLGFLIWKTQQERERYMKAMTRRRGIRLVIFEAFYEGFFEHLTLNI